MEIEMLSDVNKIRKRPSVVYGFSGKEGVLTAIRTVVSLFMPCSREVDVSVLDDNVVQMDFLGINTSYFGINRIMCIDKDTFKIENEGFNEYFIFRSTCEVMDTYLCTGDDTVKHKHYEEGELISSKIRLKKCMGSYDPSMSLRILYKPSKQVFDFDSIKKEDLSFVSIL